MSTGRGARVGFRCVAELAPADVPLRVPAPAAPVPLVRSEGSLQLFGGVAEAERISGNRFTGVMMPIPIDLADPLERVRQASATSPVPQDAPWLADLSPPDAALLARCVRSID